MRSAIKNNAILWRWDTTLARRGEAPAVLAPSGETLRTFQDIEAEAQTLAKDLEQCRVSSVVAIQIGNSSSWPALLLALFRCGLIPLPLGKHIEKTERDAALETCRASVLLETRDDGEISKSNLKPQTSNLKADFLKLTSGTTSAPRAVRFQAHQLVADCDNICETMGFGENDINFGIIPFSHSYGFSNLITPLLCRGVPLVASEDRMPRAVLHDLARSGATVFPGMPVFYEKLSELENGPEFAKLRLCISAGAPLSMRIAERFSAKFGGLKIHTFYGSSECGGIGYDASDALDYAEGFAGEPMKNVRIIPLDSDEETSRIRIESNAVGDGYFPDADPASLGGGRFIPSDLVRITPRGMFLVGRASDVINIAGRKLNPAEVETRLAQFSGVKQIVVFGVPSTLRNEEAVACVAGAVRTDELLRFARTTLSTWQVPKDIWLVDEIPVNERGKISRRELAQRYLRFRHLAF
jgi:long-chain acyl-CoA synthetase